MNIPAKVMFYSSNMRFFPDDLIMYRCKKFAFKPFKDEKQDSFQIR